MLKQKGVLVAIVLAMLAIIGPIDRVRAQGCGPSNPNCIVSTAPPGTSDNRAASTAFVQNAVAGAQAHPGGTNGQVQYNNSGAFGGLSQVDVPRGGTGAAGFSAGLPIVGAGTSPLATGTKTGNTTTFATSTGSLTPGNCVTIDASGNLVDNGSACGGGAAAIYPTIAAAVASAPLSATVFQTQGNLTAGDYGGATYLQVPTQPTSVCTFQLANGNWAKLISAEITPQMCRSSGDTNDAPMFNRFATYLSNYQSVGRVPPLTYSFTSQVTFTAPVSWRTKVDASGAIFTTTGAISAFDVTGGAYLGGIDFINFTIDQQNNATAVYGWRLFQSGNIHLINPVVRCGGVTFVNYAAIALIQSDNSNPDTGAFWTQIVNAQIYSISASTFPFGIYMFGSGGNATVISGGLMSTGVYGVYIAYNPTSPYLANSIVIQNMDFDHLANVVAVSGTAGADGTPYGLRIVNNRAESISQNFYVHLGGINATSLYPTYLSGNSLIGVTSYISASGVVVRSNDYATSAGLYGAISVQGSIVANLPPCNAASRGLRSLVTDASGATTFLSAVVGGGSNNVPVVCDGSSWKIG